MKPGTQSDSVNHGKWKWYIKRFQVAVSRFVNDPKFFFVLEGVTFEKGELAHTDILGGHFFKRSVPHLVESYAGV